MNRYLLIATVLAAAGCATTGEELNQSEVSQTIESAGGQLQNDDSLESAATPVTVVSEPESLNDSTGSESGIEDIEAPTVEVEQEQVAMLPPESESEIVCTREKVTGSILKTKVCRSRSDIERDRENGLKEMRRIKSELGVNAPRPGISGQF